MAERPAPKTPGTHPAEDKSQQPRQEESPSSTERAAEAREDHTRQREKLVSGERRSQEQRPAKSGNDSSS